MAKCSRCGRDTELWVNASPLCAACDSLANGLAKSERVLQLLREEFALAKADLAAASERFEALTREVPSGVPHPDGSLRINNAARDLSQAREDLMKTAARLNSFIIHGIAPSDLE
jgi:hypothetical protein